MGMRRILVAVICGVLAMKGAVAQGLVTERLIGEALFGSSTLVDPPPGEPSGTHAYLTITGPAARRMFHAMSAPIQADACQPGWRSRRAGHLVCSLGRRPSEAQCDFALLLARGQLASGRPC